MAKKQDHTGIRNNHLFCFNCGGSYQMNYPQPINMAAALMKQFHKDHKGCPKIWEPPVVDQSLSEKDKAIWWSMGMNGERGMSSEAMHWVLYFNADGDKIPIVKRHHPADPDDFRRCYLLLETVPEWKAKLHLMKPVSPVWSNLVDNWDKLTEMIKELMAGKKNDMYEFMKSLGC